MDWLFPLLGASAISSLEKGSNYFFHLRLSLGQVRDPEELLPNLILNLSVIFLKLFGICLGVVRGLEPAMPQWALLCNVWVICWAQCRLVQASSLRLWQIKLGSW